MSKFQEGHLRAAKLTPSDVFEMRRLYADEKWSQGRLARHFGVSVGQVGRIVRGESWQQYEQPLSDAQVEHRGIVSGEPAPTPQEIEASELALLAKLNTRVSETTPQEDPLEEIMRRRSQSGQSPTEEKTDDQKSNG